MGVYAEQRINNQYVALMRRINALEVGIIVGLSVGDQFDYAAITDIPLHPEGGSGEYFYGIQGGEIHRYNSSLTSVNSFTTDAIVGDGLAFNGTKLFTDITITGTRNIGRYAEDLSSRETQWSIAAYPNARAIAATADRVFKIKDYTTLTTLLVWNTSGTAQSDITIANGKYALPVTGGLLSPPDGSKLYVPTQDSIGGGITGVQMYSSTGSYQKTIAIPTGYASSGYGGYGQMADNFGFIYYLDEYVSGGTELRLRIVDSRDDSEVANAQYATSDSPGYKYVLYPNRHVVVSGDGTIYTWGFERETTGPLGDEWSYFLLAPKYRSTLFYRYPTASADDRQALGYPDAGVSVPANTSFNGRSAWSTLTLTGNAANNETVTLNDRTYTFKTTLTGAANEVKIGASASASLDNLIAAIMGTDGAGTTYGESTVPHATMGAVASTLDTMIASSYVASSAGDAYATTETMANGSWTASTLGGANPYVEGIAVRANAVTDMRDAIEALAPYYINAATGNPFNWTASSADNLYFKAVGTYYDWQADISAGARVTELSLNEIDSCLDKLEASSPV